MRKSMAKENWYNQSSHVVQWLGFGAFTAAAGVRFPAWENIFPVLHLEEYCPKCTFFVLFFFCFCFFCFFFLFFCFFFSLLPQPLNLSWQVTHGSVAKLIVCFISHLIHPQTDASVVQWQNARLPISSKQRAGGPGSIPGRCSLFIGRGKPGFEAKRHPFVDGGKLRRK